MSNVIHIKKFMSGEMSPSEAHKKYAWGGKRCNACNGAAAVRCLSFAPFTELEQRAMPLLLDVIAKNDGRVPIVEFTYGKFVRIGEAFACSGCQKDLAKQAASGPSWVLHEFQLPPKDTFQVGVPGGAA